MDSLELLFSIIPTHQIIKLVYLSIACGAMSFLITKAAIFNFFHEWLEKKSAFLEHLFSCPLCTSVWISAFLTVIYQPLVLDWGWRPAWQSMSRLSYLLIPLDYMVTIMVMVTLAAVVVRIIYSAYKPIMG
jgi:hypothetical protein